MNRFTFRQKLWLPLVLCWVCLLGITLRDAFEMRSLRVQERMRDLQNVSETAFSVVKEYGALAQEGKLSADEARAQALARLKAMRYGEDGYFVVSNSKSVVVMHPLKPQIDGKDMSGFTDAAGMHVFQSVAAIASSGRSSGFVDYLWPKPGSDVPVVKKSLEMYYQPWDWGISTGTYIDDIDADFHATLARSLGLMVFVGLLMSIAVTVVTRSLVGQLGGEPAYAVDIAGRIAGGDLATQVQTRKGDSSSMLHAMARMQQSLIDTIGQIKSSADSIAGATQQIAAGNTDLSQRTEEQAASLQETASSVEELTSIVKHNADNARQASTLAGNASDIAIKGGEVVGRVVETMDGIKTSSNRIGDILGVIEGIAFQTNILALNAAVEAARAGELGRGFAVVAGEVRILAQRSAAAAKEIKELIGESVGRVNDGSVLVEEAGTVIEDVVVAVKRVADIMGEISAASEEQSSGIEQINLAVTQMDHVTQQNAALVEQAAAAALSLQEQARSLNEAVSVFKLADVDG
ncbi:methyl-accepting chemotaxis protein [Paraburkholderia sp. MPAMCS5]|uniref:methyl-accepting chemotaxis protein n=1 Tax=Paraburkholderia sp. MPAMCS5 TaxID=3112563 RepID=UPI002E19016E|nr:methyl-accepting chemotaxis protein [Paraburkholderia sp. MPAMCS5]